MQNKTAQQKQQQQAIELCGGVVRGFSKIPEYYFRGSQLYRDQQRVPLYACHIQADLKNDSFKALRGVADSIHLRFIHCDEVLHHSLLPETKIERFLFEMLEQMRVDSLVPDVYTGMKSNLTARFAEWSMQYHHSGLTENNVGLLIYTIAQVVWSRLNNTTVLEETEDLLEATRAGISPIIGDDLYQLKKFRFDQTEYAKHALSLAAKFKQLIGDESDSENYDEQEDELEKIDLPEFNLLFNFDDAQEGISNASLGESKSWIESKQQYSVYNSEYDTTKMVTDFIRANLLDEYRQQLDLRIQHQGINIPMLARRLKQLFAIPEQDGWNFSQEQGYIDGRRLAQVITSPTERRIFKDHRYQPQADCVLSFLIDCSGSMKQHAINIAMLLDIFCRAADRAGIKTEILGFTTSSWSGGRPMQEWIKQGKPNNPGRMNEVSHLIFKTPDQTWRKSRPAIAALMKQDMFREGVDGEAIDWAAGRLLQGDENTKILTVISDGSPMDSATNIANDAYYLDNHLKQVISKYEHQAELSIFGLGVQLDLSSYYRNYTVLHMEERFSNATFNDILAMWRSKKC